MNRILDLIHTVIVGRRSVASITGSLTRMADQLRAHAVDQHANGTALQQHAADIRQQAADAYDESRKASATAARIAELVG